MLTIALQEFKTELDEELAKDDSEDENESEE